MHKKVGVAYIPVLHRGYLDFVRTCEEKGVQEVWVIGDELLEAYEELDYINRKDRLRALPLPQLLQALQTLCTFPVKELTTQAAAELDAQQAEITMPNEDIGKVIAKECFSNSSVTYIDIFLRWNKENVGENKEPESAVVSLNDFQKDVLKQMLTESAKSFDWWRQVGAALVKEQEIVFVTHNEHMPEEQQPNIDGDTRALFKKGIHINYVTAAHAEVVAIAAAAKAGIATEGAELFVTDFPCPYCARLIAKAGIKKVYFMKGYAVLEGDAFLKEEGVEVVRVAADA